MFAVVRRNSGGNMTLLRSVRKRTTFLLMKHSADEDASEQIDSACFRTTFFLEAGLIHWAEKASKPGHTVAAVFP